MARVHPVGVTELLYFKGDLPRGTEEIFHIKETYPRVWENFFKTMFQFQIRVRCVRAKQ